MSIYLMRHGETRLAGRYCGSLNLFFKPSRSRSSESGRPRLSQIPIDACYSSPQLRAKQTAEIIHSPPQGPCCHPSFL